MSERLLLWIESEEGRKPPAEAFPDPAERRIAELYHALEVVAGSASRCVLADERRALAVEDLAKAIISLAAIEEKRIT